MYTCTPQAFLVISCHSSFVLFLFFHFVTPKLSGLDFLFLLLSWSFCLLVGFLDVSVRFLLEADLVVDFFDLLLCLLVVEAGTFLFFDVLLFIFGIISRSWCFFKGAGEVNISPLLIALATLTACIHVFFLSICHFEIEDRSYENRYLSSSSNPVSPIV